MKCSVIIVAAGTGKRMNVDIPKQYLMIKDKPILAYTIEKFELCSYISEIIVVTGKDEVEYCKDNIVKKYNFEKVSNIIIGGSERQYSVFNGLSAVDKDTDFVLIHDGVRPFIKNEDIIKIIEQTELYDACVIGVKAKNTIKICDESDFVLNTPNRKYIWEAQTPQCFKYEIIVNAYKKAIDEKFIATDDSMIVENYGKKVKMIEGSYDNIKITTPEDLIFLESIQ